ncbi:GTP-binding protein Di-Ras2-like [Asterias rubens]|uniref:GTP-binding protein Di-Ras2-like n=1 Tax=Asterias rubens TaxID=7604 RepID=UPI001455C30E|nr:GTP-binding protein Di-Ras2-like [Asterias rubens]XP_033629951.1 GTP-binding protein Di-Ras2-like [Asterias rubens]
MDDWERYRLVVLGAGKVGKTSIISQFLGNKFEEKYKETVEDLHCREYNVNGHCIKVDILDTSGGLQFPAMRRLSISTANAFLLVYSVDDHNSLEVVRQIYEQIREQRSNFDELPIVVVGNKTDRADFRAVEEIEMHDLIVREAWNCAFLEVCARENLGVLDIFQKLLQMAKIPVARELSPVLKRRMSEYGYKRRKDGRGSFKENDKEMSRSRSLMRRTGRPKVKQNQDPTKSDCIIS